MISKKRISLFLILFFLLFTLGFGAVNAASINSPVITGSEDGFSKNKPLINGKTDTGTLVHIYIDGVYSGKTKILFNESEAQVNFSYESFISLKSGDHRVWAIAEDEDGNKSELSNIFIFNIEPGVPSPTLFQPLTDKNNANRLIIVGVIKNDLKVKVYIDDKLDGEFTPESHKSGTASFSYQAKNLLSRGRHSIYVVAVDNKGKESEKSNLININTALPTIENSAKEEIKKIDINKESADNDINQLIEEGLNSEQEEGGKEEDERKISPSLVIFILFFAGVIGWIIWVNRELVKEKNDNIKADAISEDKKDDKRNE